ncbi:cytochrome c-type biogenesis protein CcmE [Cupriavidus sp. OV038]|jgi:cytochrome c-type biogenesis protein CcmE|uniref:cytochrome c maturation protein CcmE n=1 Tax=unclassified Cupriavidus TaxID=2640874 RepID=UPI0008DF2BCC|nr:MULTISPECIES: cytochrome c maturation protein CcmE [unclassified Cupriavidus]SFD37838.1 cytochrome c-type biogenesis protein CcmE [Cupriavidus sp. OV038]SFQ08038.1 cytochrome c-type biogenesis protein CcmE [Cupriavidus sp. OV096]
MTTRRRRLGWLLAALACAGVATALVLNAFRGNLVFFFSPTQVAAQEAPAGRAFRLGGLVETGSLRREGDGMTIRFIVTDTMRQVPVVYRGLLPDLFREGKGVVARGQLRDGVFQATEVLAKHDENYMPPEAAEALKQAAQTKARIPETTPR